MIFEKARGVHSANVPLLEYALFARYLPPIAEFHMQISEYPGRSPESIALAERVAVVNMS
jgi:hypothetical protein